MHRRTQDRPGFSSVELLAILLVAGLGLLSQARSVAAIDVTYGAAQEFDPELISRISSAEIGTDKFVVCYVDDHAAQCRAATVSGTVASFGSEVEVHSDVIAVQDVRYNLAACRLADDKFAVAYASASVRDGYTTIGSVSGTTITLGAVELQFETGDTEWMGCEGIDTDKYVITYNDKTDSDVDVGVIQVFVDE